MPVIQNHSKSEILKIGLGGRNGIVTGGGFDIGVGSRFTVAMSGGVHWNAQGGPLNRGGKRLLPSNYIGLPPAYCARADG